MSAHTPGPWKVTTKSSPRGAYVNFGVIGVHDDVARDGFIARVERPSTQDADARLIAAAPEMLEALEWMVELGTAYSIPQAKMARAKRAIAKATGGAK